MSVLFVSFVSSKKICVSVRWVTLGVRPPTCENMYVHWLGYIVGASPLCVCVQLVILRVQRPPCVCPLEDNLCWILACCLLRFASFFISVWDWSKFLINPNLLAEIPYILQLRPTFLYSLKFLFLRFCFLARKSVPYINFTTTSSPFFWPAQLMGLN